MATRYWHVVCTRVRIGSWFGAAIRNGPRYPAEEAILKTCDGRYLTLRAVRRGMVPVWTKDLGFGTWAVLQANIKEISKHDYVQIHADLLEKEEDA